MPEDQIAEILIFRQQQPIFAVSAEEHVCIRRTRRDLRHVNNVVPKFAQQEGQTRIHAFVDQPTHAGLAINELFIGQIVRSESLGGANVLRRQARMVGQDLFRRHSSTELAQDSLDWHARSSDYGLAAHDLWIYFDSLVCGHSVLSGIGRLRVCN